MINNDAQRCSCRTRVSLVLFLLILCVAGALRLFVADQAFYSTFDTSTPGLMALRILEGERPLFYYGQNYLGALEAYLVALIFLVAKPSLITLALAPILFSLGWMVSMFLLFRELYRPKAGWVGMLVAAFPCWHILWYNVGSYGGYPAALMFGTLALWVIVRMTGRSLSNREEWIHILSLGWLAGLGIWTHYLAATYLSAGLYLLFIHFRKRKWDKGLLLKFLVGGLPFLATVWPCLVSFGKYGGAQVVETSFRLGQLAENLGIFFDRILPKLVIWSPDQPLFFRLLAIVSISVPAGLYLVCLVKHRKDEDAWRLWLPVVFLILFFLVYLPNGMASAGAPRYTITLASIMTATFFAAPIRYGTPVIKKLCWLLLFTWVGYHGVSAVFGAQSKAEGKASRVAARAQILQKAQQTGSEWISMVGSPIFGLGGQTFTFLAQDRIQFVSCYDERHQPTAQAMEAVTNPAYACEDDKLRKVVAAIDELGGHGKIIRDQAVCFVHDVKIPDAGRVMIAPQSVEVFGHTVGSGKELSDRRYDSFATGLFSEDSGVILTFDAVVPLHSIWLIGTTSLQQEFPELYRIEASDDGENWREVRTSNRRMVPSFTLIGRPYIKGYLGRLDINVDEVDARMLRLRFMSGQPDQPSWTVSEVRAFSREPSADHADSLQGILEIIKEEGIDFTVSDRNMSARILETLGINEQRPAAYPRYNTKFRSTQLPRIIKPRDGLGVALVREIADASERLLKGLYGEGVIKRRLELGRYVYLVLTKPSKEPEGDLELLWNDHLFLLTTEGEARWY